MTAIKTGRYTHAKKTLDIMEVKGIANFNGMIDAQTASELKSANGGSLSSVERPESSDSPAAGEEAGQKEPPLQPSTDEMQTIIGRIAGIHKKYSIWTPDFIAKKIQNEQLFLVCQFCCLLQACNEPRAVKIMHSGLFKYLAVNEISLRSVVVQRLGAAC